METQPDNHNRRVSDEQLLEFVAKWEALVELERKAKEQQKAKDSSYQMTYSSSFKP